jgi:hypothetical protein
LAKRGKTTGNKRQRERDKRVKRQEKEARRQSRKDMRASAHNPDNKDEFAGPALETSSGDPEVGGAGDPKAEERT